MKLEALYNAVIVKPLELEETTHGNIIVPDLGNEKNKLGKVVAVGNGYYTITGNWLDTVLEVGDVVVLPTMGFTKLEHEGEEYWIGVENQVLARLNNETEEKI
jgi:co-chaperonin GroES (HSP10)